MIPRLPTWRVCACAVALLLLTVPSLSQAVMHHHHHLRQSATSASSGSSPSVTSFTTSGPDSALNAPKSKSPEAPSKNSTLKSSSEDLTESQSSQSSAMLQTSGAPVSSTHAHHHYQHYQHAVQHAVQPRAPTPVSSSSASQSQSLGGALGDLSSTASQPQAQTIAQTAATGNTQFSVNQAQLQQQMAMMGAKPGAFTLVSNQQVGPGHVTMIGYTTPIIKVGGIVKHEQQQQQAAPARAQAPVPVQSSPVAQSHAALQQEPRQSVSAVPHHHHRHHSSIESAAAAAPSSSGSAQSSASMDSPVKMYFEKQQPIGSAAAFPSHSGFYGPEAGRALGISNYRMAPPQGGGQMLKAQSAELKAQLQSAPTFIAGAGPDFQGVAVEKPKPFLVYKPGFLEKLKHHQAAYPQAGPHHHQLMQLQQPQQLAISQPQQASPQLVSPISMAHFMAQQQQQLQRPLEGGFGPAKVQIEKHGHSLSNLVPIDDVDSNEIGSPLSGSFGERVHQQFPPPTIPQLVQQGGAPQGFRPISIAKQMTMDALAQQRSHIMNAHLGGQRGPGGPQMLMAQPPQQQPQPQQIQMAQQVQFQQQQQQQQAQPQSIAQFQPQQFQQAIPQFSPFQQPSPQAQQKMFGRPMEMSQLMSQPSPFQEQQSIGNPFQVPQQQQLQQQQSAKLRFAPEQQQQQSQLGIPQPQVSSTITMPEPSQKSDPRRELQEQINFVLQNSPNLSENSRSKHRTDIMKAVQESMADSDTSPARPVVAAPKPLAAPPTQFESQFSSPGSFASQIDSLLPSPLQQQQQQQSYSPFRPSEASPFRSSEASAPSAASQESAASFGYVTGNYKSTPVGSASATSASKYAPESSLYGRYSQESTMFLPQDSILPLSQSSQASQGGPQLSPGYKAKLQQEIQRYLQDQIEKSNAAPVNFITGPNGPTFTLSSNGAIQSQPAMMKYQQSPLRKVHSSLVEKSPSQMLYNSEQGARGGSREATSQVDPGNQGQGGGHHFVLARQTEFIQPSSSQASSATVKAPEGSSSATSASASSKSSSHGPYSSLMSQLAASSSSPSSSSAVSNLVPESSKTMRGYSQWWKESALVPQSSPMVPISALYPTGIAQ